MGVYDLDAEVWKVAEHKAHKGLELGNGKQPNLVVFLAVFSNYPIAHEMVSEAVVVIYKHRFHISECTTARIRVIRNLVSVCGVYIPVVN